MELTSLITYAKATHAEADVLDANGAYIYIASKNGVEGPFSYVMFIKGNCFAAGMGINKVDLDAVLDAREAEGEPDAPEK